MQAVIQDILDPGNIFAHLSYIFLITSMLMTSLRKLRVLALMSGLSAMAHFIFRTEDTASLVWEIAFVLANGIQLSILIYRSRTGDVSPEEQALLQHVLKVQDPINQRRMLGLLRWRDVAVGEVLIRQGQANPPLAYVASGAARIEHDGQMVGVCGEGDFLGEMSLVSGDRATATVVVTNTMRIAVFDRDALAQLMRSSPDIGNALDAALNRGLAAKVLRMNVAAAAVR